MFISTGEVFRRLSFIRDISTEEDVIEEIDALLEELKKDLE